MLVIYLSAYGRFRTGPKGDDFDTTVGVTFDRFAKEVFRNPLKVSVWGVLGLSWERLGDVLQRLGGGLGIHGAIFLKFQQSFRRRWAHDGRSWWQVARKMGHDSAKLGQDGAKTAQDKACLAILQPNG